MSSLSENLFSALKDKYPEKIETIDNTPNVIILDIAVFLEVIKKAKECGFNFLVDITGLEQEGLYCIYHLMSLATREMVRIKVKLDEKLELPSLTGEWLAANVQEREVFDMFGIKFTNHPNLKRILCPENFVGHPLRKNFEAAVQRYRGGC